MQTELDRPLITYAQNREDLYLWALLGHRTNGTYVDIGCNEERSHSVTRLFYERGWSGLNIDANESFGAQYRVRTRDRFIATGIGAEPGQLLFRVYPEQHGLSTFDPATKEAHVDSGMPYKDVTVPVRTLDDVLAESGLSHVDFLKIDVEGLEPAVLHGLDLSVVRPTVIVLEASSIAACEAILLPNRYHREFFDGLNVYYVDDDAEDVTIFKYAERVLHKGFLTALEEQLRHELEEERLAPAILAPEPRIAKSKLTHYWRAGRARLANYRHRRHQQG